VDLESTYINYCLLERGRLHILCGRYTFSYCALCSLQKILSKLIL